jgi:hypothetical protein
MTELSEEKAFAEYSKIQISLSEEDEQYIAKLFAKDEANSVGLFLNKNITSKDLRKRYDQYRNKIIGWRQRDIWAQSTMARWDNHRGKYIIF